MSRTRIFILGLAVGMSASTVAQAQMAYTRDGVDARSAPRAANTARSGRTMPPSRGEAPSGTAATNRKRESSGPTLPGICIGCGAK